MRRLWLERARQRKDRRRQSVRERTAPHAPAPDSGLGRFEVLCRVDAYADYLALVEARDAEEAAELASEDLGSLKWESQGVVEFDARYYVTLDQDGLEIEGTEVGDR
jgi:hypothetical protein